MIDKILPPIIGGIIGYFTNWLAIKMLFLPREPKYIGKFKLPFTPGLIPKERARLSKKIAMVCEENILNKETIEQNLFNEKNKEKVYLLIEKNFNNLIEKDYTINEILEKINKNNILEIIEEKGYNYIKDYLQTEENQQYISNILTQKIIYFIKNIDKYEELKLSINDIILNILLDEEFKNKILNKKINEIISNQNITKLKFTIFENMPNISEFIIDKIENNENLQNKLRTIVKNIIEENVGGIAGLFLNSDKIYESIKKNIISNIRNSENQNIMGLKIFEYISSYQNKEILGIYNKFPTEIKNIIDEKISRENLQEILNKNFFDKYFKENALYEVIERNIYNFEEKIHTYIKSFVANELKDKILIIYKDILNKNKDKILSLKINIILNKIKLNNNKDIIFSAIEKFIQNEGDKILSQIHIAEIVENKINSFEISTIENIIISVAKKELNAITIIGGVLGFIIGLIPIFY